MNNAHSPARGPQGRVPVIGHPWHGLVRDGQLRLPDSSTRSYPQPQPSSASEGPDVIGSAHLVKRPGIGPVSLTPAQAALAADNKHQWRDTAILSGSTWQLYGQQLDGWLYFAPDGSRWRVRIPLGNSQYAFADTLNFDVQLDRFGDFGVAPESYTYSVSLAGWQPTDQPLLWSAFDNISTETAVTAAYLYVESVQPDGSKAAIMAHQRRFGVLAEDASRPRYDPCVRAPLGWLELAISGPGQAATVALTVLRSRDQTLRVVQYQPIPPATPRWVGVHFVATSETTYDTNPFQFVGPQPSEVGEGGERVFAAAPIWDIDITNIYERVLAIWPDDAGGWQECAIRYTEHTVSETSDPPPGLTVEQTSSYTETVRYALLANGVEVAAVEASSAETMAGTATFAADTVAIDGNGDWYRPGYVASNTVTHTYSVSYDGTTASDTWTETISTLGAGIIGSASTNDYPNRLNAFPAEIKQTLFNLPASISYGFGFYLPDRVAWLQVARLSSQVIALRRHDYLLDTTSVSPHKYTAAATPSGARGVVTTIPHSDNRRFAAWDPHSGEVEWLSETPCCWV